MHVKKPFLLLWFVGLGCAVNGQSNNHDSSTHRAVTANASLLKKSTLYQALWGRNRRVEWATPVSVPILWLDSIYGGLKPQEAGGGNESKSMQLRSASGKEYALRSINKSREAVVPADFKNTFVESIIKDQVSGSYPYGAFPVTIMQAAAGIYHTAPILVYVPHQAALDSFDKRFGDDLYLLEQRAAGDWSGSANLGNFHDYASTEKVIRKLKEDNKCKADQPAFIKARLFDMLIADWDRHEDNWRWGELKTPDQTLYVPVPRDRDQAFYTHNGILIDFLLPVGGYAFMQNFSSNAGNMRTLNTEEKNMDRFFSNEMDRDDWINAANALQQSLTDSVIRKSVLQLPPEIFAVSGEELIAKLIARRGQLAGMAVSYYAYLAREVEIVGSSKREFFEISRNDDSTTIQIFRINKEGIKSAAPIYQRVFKPGETAELRVFGIDGEDVFSVIGNSTAIRLRIIGGPANDSITQTGTAPVYVYDDKANRFNVHSAKWKLSSLKTVHEYSYLDHDYSSKGWGPLFSYDHQDRVYVGLSYRFKNYRWRRRPFATQHVFGVKYSITQHAVSTRYAALYPNLVHHWDLQFNAKFDAAGWVNFAGLGNETVRTARGNDYYQMRGGDLLAGIGLHRAIGKSVFDIAVFYQRVKITNDTDRYAAKIYQPVQHHLFDAGDYAGIKLSWGYIRVNDKIVPTKGFSVLATGTLADDFFNKAFFQNYSARLQAWLPFSKKFSLSIKTGGTTVVGNSTVINSARPFQHAVIGGPETFRGYNIERFWGKTSFYNNNELRFITPIHSYLLNARIGLLAFFDDGRVWMPDESSKLLHTSYGGGILLASFNQFSCTFTYGVSKEVNLFQFRFNTLL